MILYIKFIHVKVGTPFPIVHPKISSHYAASVNEIDVKADATNEIFDL